MTPKSPEERVLEKLVQAARGEPIPDLQTPALEAQLRQQWLAVVERERHRASVRTMFVRWAPVALAAAVVLIAGVTTFRHRTDRVTVPPRGSATQSLDGSQLREGRSIATEGSPLTVTHAGKATWTLAPWSRARVLGLSPCLTLALEAGRIDAAVLPSKQTEVFAIETDTHRIAVRGTQFSVQLDPSGLLVEVSSGAVIVSRRDQAGPNGPTLLTAPQRLRFPLQGSASVPSVTPRVPLANVPHSRARISPANAEPVAPAASQVADAAELPVRPTALEQETALDLVRAAAARCFAQSAAVDAEPSSDLRVRVETQLTLSIAPQGGLTEISFEPPIPLPIADCTQRELTGWSATPTQLGARASRAIILVK